MSDKSNQINREGSQKPSDTAGGTCSAMVCEENELSDQCVQPIRTGSKDVSYGFYS
jgi:hypothetical protein